MASTPIDLLPNVNAVCEELRRRMAGMSAEQKAAFLLASARLAAAQADSLSSDGRHRTEVVVDQCGSC
ncbi:MAG TPA: hypothetical protein PLD23_00310 [Armatimonadota bacterium]|nr:hypothetical protein [Armatimonadota bacterium]HQK91912.1 hypothetical protein [Armatimonadota bacterium]